MPSEYIIKYAAPWNDKYIPNNVPNKTFGIDTDWMNDVKLKLVDAGGRLDGNDEFSDFEESGGDFTNEFNLNFDRNSCNGEMKSVFSFLASSENRDCLASRIWRELCVKDSTKEPESMRATIKVQAKHAPNFVMLQRMQGQRAGV